MLKTCCNYCWTSLIYCVRLTLIILLSYYYFTPMADIGYYDGRILVYLCMYYVFFLTTIVVGVTTKTETDENGNTNIIQDRKVLVLYHIIYLAMFILEIIFVATLKNASLYDELTIYPFLYYCSHVMVGFTSCWFALVILIFIVVCIYAYCSSNGNGKQRPHRATLQTIRKYTQDTIYGKLVDIVDKFDNPSCAICLEDFDKDDEIKMLNCKHYFHKTCLEDWLKKNGTCPYCRRAIDV